MQEPVALFNRLYDRARRARVPLHDAMAVATADPRGKPSVRFLLLKHADDRGFVFYTNTRSRKGRELARNGRAALAFYWDKTGRQVRVEGRTVRVTDAEADAYWITRPRISRLGAIASQQSKPMKSRLHLAARVAGLAVRYAGRPVPRPAWWTGFRLIPSAIEFWTRRAHRMHDRLLYRRTGRTWKKVVLQP